MKVQVIKEKLALAKRKNYSITVNSKTGDLFSQLEGFEEPEEPIKERHLVLLGTIDTINIWFDPNIPHKQSKIIFKR